MWRRKLCSLYDINPLLYLPSNDAATQSISTIVCICYVTCVLKSSFCTLSILLYYLALGPLAASKQRFNFIISSFHINYVWIRWAEQSSAREKDFECGKIPFSINTRHICVLRISNTSAPNLTTILIMRRRVWVNSMHAFRSLFYVNNIVRYFSFNLSNASWFTEFIFVTFVFSPSNGTIQ